MTVEASYDKPSSKQFKVISQSGSKLVLNRVFKKLMESEKEAAQPAMNAKTQLNRDNYTFELTGSRAVKDRRAIYIAGGSEIEQQVCLSWTGLGGCIGFRGHAH